jgi:transcriptional regulator with PAS, ATPase and Fis domain
MKAENKIRRALSKGLVAKYVIGDLVHESQQMEDIIHMAKQFAYTDSTVLIAGETGTGKEVLAQSIHNLSRRRKEPFVSVNCAALPEQLLESELFGYEEGAFTGSKKGGKPGLFEIAHMGTLFLDEIDTTPENVQIRLLRILQEREVMRVGGDRKIPVDVRIIAAASKDLSLSVQQDRLREDLFFRLNVLRIRIPPLRERREDIPVLLNHFIGYISKKHRMAPIELPHGYAKNLVAYDWPGNVRQLRNFSERLVLNCNLRCGRDMLDELYEELVQYPLRKQVDFETTDSASSLDHLRQKKIENEGHIILKALETAKFCRSKAAEDLGISRTTLWRKMKAAGLE